MNQLTFIFKLLFIDIIEESKAIFANNTLIIKELDQICAYLISTSPCMSVKMAGKISDKYKSLVAFGVLAFFFLIGRHIVGR